MLDAGVIPTPAAAFLVGDIGADFGVMISASHNPAPDNGIKFFSYGGTKLPDAVEDRIEDALAGEKLAPTGAGVGRIRRFADAEDRYVLHLLGTLDVSLEGLHVVIDCPARLERVFRAAAQAADRAGPVGAGASERPARRASGRVASDVRWRITDRIGRFAAFHASIRERPGSSPLRGPRPVREGGRPPCTPRAAFSGQGLHALRGLARRVGSACAGSSGQGCLG